MTSISHLLWIDLETTGVDPAADEIIEVGAILTTPDLDRVEEYTDIVIPSVAGREKINANPFVRSMHEENGLLAQIDASAGTGPWPTEQVHQRLVSLVEDELVSMLTSHGASTGSTALAGSGVGHMDLPFIRAKMPRLAQMVTYWPMDVGPMRRGYKLWVGEDLTEANAGKTHRAMDDVNCHLAEGVAFRDVLRGLGSGR